MKKKVQETDFFCEPNYQICNNEKIPICKSVFIFLLLDDIQIRLFNYHYYLDTYFMKLLSLTMKGHPVCISCLKVEMHNPMVVSNQSRFWVYVSHNLMLWPHLGHENSNTGKISGIGRINTFWGCYVFAHRRKRCQEISQHICSINALFISWCCMLAPRL